MSIRLRRGTDVERQAIIFAEGEIIYTTDLKEVWVGDGTTYGGVPISRYSNITDILDIPNPTDGRQALMTTVANDGYEWVSAIVPDGRQSAIATLDDASLWALTIDAATFLVDPATDSQADELFDLDVVGLTGAGVVNNGTTYSGGARIFDGTSYIDAPSTNAVYGTADRAFFIRFKADVLPKLPVKHYIFSYGSPAVDQTFAIAYHDVGLRLIGYSHDFDLGVLITAGQTYDLAVIVKDGMVKVYLDGVYAGQYIMGSMNTVETDPIRLGAWHDTPQEFMNGSISAFISYNRALTPLEIAYLSDAPSAVLAAKELALLVDADPAYTAQATDKQVFVRSVLATEYAASGVNMSVELLPREFKLDALTEVPNPVAGQFLRRTLDDTAYEWVNAIIPDGRTKGVASIVELLAGEVAEVTVDGVTYSEVYGGDMPIDSGTYDFANATTSYIAMTNGAYELTTKTGSIILQNAGPISGSVCLYFDGNSGFARNTTNLLESFADNSYALSAWLKPQNKAAAEYGKAIAYGGYGKGGGINLITHKSDGTVGGAYFAWGAVTAWAGTQGLPIDLRPDEWFHIAVTVNGVGDASIFVYDQTNDTYGRVDFVAPSFTIPTSDKNFTLGSNETSTQKYQGWMGTVRKWDVPLTMGAFKLLDTNYAALPQTHAEVLQALADQINAVPDYTAVLDVDRVQVMTAAPAEMTMSSNDRLSVDVYLRQFSLESLTEVPAPVEGQFLRRKFDDSGYEWVHGVNSLLVQQTQVDVAQVAKQKVQATLAQDASITNNDYWGVILDGKYYVSGAAEWAGDTFDTLNSTLWADYGAADGGSANYLTQAVVSNGKLFLGTKNGSYTNYGNSYHYVHSNPVFMGDFEITIDLSRLFNQDPESECGVGFYSINGGGYDNVGLYWQLTTNRYLRPFENFQYGNMTDGYNLASVRYGTEELYLATATWARVKFRCELGVLTMSASIDDGETFTDLYTRTMTDTMNMNNGIRLIMLYKIDDHVPDHVTYGAEFDNFTYKPLNNGYVTGGGLALRTLSQITTELQNRVGVDYNVEAVDATSFTIEKKATGNFTYAPFCSPSDTITFAELVSGYDLSPADFWRLRFNGVDYEITGADVTFIEEVTDYFVGQIGAVVGYEAVKLNRTSFLLSNTVPGQEFALVATTDPPSMLTLTTSSDYLKQSPTDLVGVPANPAASQILQRNVSNDGYVWQDLVTTVYKTRYPVALINGDAETGDVTGWTQETGGMDVRSPGAGPGNYYFWGGQNALTIGSQEVSLYTGDVTALTLQQSLCSLYIDFHYSGWSGDTDNIAVGVRFKDDVGAQIGSDLYSSGYQNSGTWTFASWNTLIPPNAVTADILLKFTRVGGTDNNGYIDNIAIYVEAPNPKLEALVDVQPPIPNTYLRRNAAGDAFEWVEQVLYGTGDPPDPATLPDGTIYIKYV